MNKIEISCDAGLGNRLGSIVSGLEVARICNLEPIICWRHSHSCFAKFFDLFETSLEIKENFPDVYDSEEDLSSYTVVEPNFDVEDGSIPIGSNIISHNESNILEKIKSSELPILYWCTEIPEYLDRASTIKNLLQIKPKKQIIDNVANFIEQNKIDSNVIGIHIRKTDKTIVKEKYWIDVILSNPDKRFFICSDSQKAEDKFRSLPNTILYPKKEYVTKRRDHKPWKIFKKGKMIKSNTLRSSGSVIEALHDLLILSHTDIQCRHEMKYSTFLHFAKYYNAIIKEIMN